MIKPGIINLDGKEYQSTELRGATEFYVDSQLHKHVEQLDDSWQLVQCGFDDELIKADSGLIRVQTLSDKGNKVVEKALSGVETFHATVLEDLTGRKTDTEKLTWKSKEEAAIEFVTGAYQRALDQLTDPHLSETETAQAQHIVANHAIIADAVTGDGDDTVANEAQAIRVKAAGYKKMVGVAEKLKSSAKAGIRALDPESETIQQDVDAVLDAVKAQAETVKQQVKLMLQGA